MPQDDSDNCPPDSEGIYRRGSSPPDPLDSLHDQALVDEVLYEAQWYTRRAVGLPLAPWEERKANRLRQLRADLGSPQGRRRRIDAVLTAWPALPWCWDAVNAAETIVADAYRQQDNGP